MDSHIVELIIEDFQRQMLHTKVNTVLTELRESLSTEYFLMTMFNNASTFRRAALELQTSKTTGDDEITNFLFRRKNGAS